MAPPRRPRYMANIALLLVWICAVAATADTRGMLARDGMGRPVAWWVVLKLPAHARTARDTAVKPTPCDCAAPNCSGLATHARDVSARRTGLCYLYADAAHPTLRYFRELGYDCLGQGGNDPLSHTLRQIQRRQGDRRDEDGGEGDGSDAYWALFNDQLNGIAQDAARYSSKRVAQNKTICSGGDLFSAHAKGAIGFALSSGGFYLQTSTPNYPDPSQVDVAERGGDTFIPLGCQRDDNVHFAQHMLGLSMEIDQVERLGEELQTARLCSGNFYHGLRTQLASANLLEVAQNESIQDARRTVYDALLNSHTVGPRNSSVFSLRLKTFQNRRQYHGRSAVYEELPWNTSLDTFVKTLSRYEHNVSQAESVEVIVKSPSAAVPPWALVAETLKTDVSVASWWDGGYGIPNICAGDDYSTATQQFCMNDSAHGVRLNDDGTARHNVENLIEATWEIEATQQKVIWHLVGGNVLDGNHAKWGIATPRASNTSRPLSATFADNTSRPLSATFADLNMEGFPCSSRCNGSQAGRGGSFFTLHNEDLHRTLVSMVSRACPCESSPPSVAADIPRSNLQLSDDSFEALRMCQMGCWRKIQDKLMPQDLPILSRNASSFWDPSG